MRLFITHAPPAFDSGCNARHLEATVVSGRKTVLIVDDDLGILRVLSDGLSSVLDLFDVVTASNGLEAIQELENRTVDVLVTDLAMPVMDGFSLIAYVTNRRSALPVVVLSGMVGSMLDQRLAGYGGLRVLRKPASYQEVATCVLEEIERVDRGQIEGIPLSGVLQLIEAERRSCNVTVRSGRRRGQLQFESGRLVNAFSDDFGAEGEAAAYDILSWPDTAIEFEPLPANVRRLIHTPMQLLLVELATAQDRESEAGDPPPVAEPTMAGQDEANPGPHEANPGPHGGAGGTDADEALDGPTAEPDGSATDDRASEAPDPVGITENLDPVAGFHADGAPAPAAVDDPERVDDSILLDEPPPTVAAEPAAALVTGVAAPDAPAEPDTPAAPEAPAGPGEPGGVATVPAAPEAPAAAEVPEAPAAAPAAYDPHVRDMLAAIERLAQRAKSADEALAAVASEIDAFREAQSRFDEEIAQRDRRRRDLERFRDEVGQLAREILGRVDGLFDAMAGDPAPLDAGEERPAT
jgi:CheY-like chemotaxis protein